MHIYYRKHNKQLGCLLVEDCKSHLEALELVEKHLEEGVEIYNKPLLALIENQEKEEKLNEKQTA